MGFDFSTSFTDIGTGLFGSDASGKQSGSTTQSSEQTATNTQNLRETEKFTVNRAAIDKTIKDILSRNDGLAAILEEEQGAGLFNSTVAQDAVGELIAKIAGEIGKLTGETVRTGTGTERAEQTAEGRSDTKTKTKSESDGLFDSISGLF